MTSDEKVEALTRAVETMIKLQEQQVELLKKLADVATFFKGKQEAAEGAYRAALSSHYNLRNVG